MKFLEYVALTSLAFSSETVVDAAVVKTGGYCTMKNIKSTDDSILYLFKDFWLTSDTCLFESDCCGQMVVLDGAAGAAAKYEATTNFPMSVCWPIDQSDNNKNAEGLSIPYTPALGYVDKYIKTSFALTSSNAVI